MMRASMAEVMGSQYVRTAVLKGMPFKRVVMRHALRNALIAPFTVMILQINYLLSGVIVTEVFFAYDGFGRRLYEAAQFDDIFIVEACTMVAVARRRAHAVHFRNRLHLSQSAHQVQLRSLHDRPCTPIPRTALRRSPSSSTRSHSCANRPSAWSASPSSCSGWASRSWRRSCLSSIRLKQDSSFLLAGPLTEGTNGAFFWLGTDDLGRDILSRLIWGAQRVFIWAGLATLSRLLDRHAHGRRGRLSRRLVGRGAELHRQSLAFRMSFPSHRRSTSIIIGRFGATTAQHHRRRHARHRAAGHAHRARHRARPQDARLYRRRRGARREAALHHDRRAPAQCARAADRRCLPADGLRHHRHRRSSASSASACRRPIPTGAR